MSNPSYPCHGIRKSATWVTLAAKGPSLFAGWSNLEWKARAAYHLQHNQWIIPNPQSCALSARTKAQVMSDPRDTQPPTTTDHWPPAQAAPTRGSTSSPSSKSGTRSPAWGPPGRVWTKSCRKLRTLGCRVGKTCWVSGSGKSVFFFGWELLY